MTAAAATGAATAQTRTALRDRLLMAPKLYHGYEK